MKRFQLFLFFCYSFSVRAQIISTVAGNGLGGYGGDGGAATVASVGSPGAMAFDADGNYYFTAFNNTVRKVSIAGIISTIAGNGTIGFSGDGGLATNAQMNGASGIAIDRNGDVFISDMYNNRIRKIHVSTGIITTFAGTGIGAYSGDNGPATAAAIYSPDGLAFDTSGNLYFADHGNNRIRKINSAGIIYTIGGNGSGSSSGDGTLATVAGLNVYSLYVDIMGELYFCDNNKIRKIDKNTGIISTVAGTGIQGYSGDNGLAISAQFFFPRNVIGDLFGNIYISDMNNNRIRFVNSTGYVYTIVGDGSSAYGGDSGPASAGKINSPRGIALDSCGNLYIIDNGNKRIRKVTYPKCNYLNVNEYSIQHATVYPNPCTEELHIDGVTTRSEYMLLNVTGIIKQRGILKKGGNTLPVTYLPHGVYMLLITDQDGIRKVHKVVKE